MDGRSSNHTDKKLQIEILALEQDIIHQLQILLETDKAKDQAQDLIKIIEEAVNNRRINDDLMRNIHTPFLKMLEKIDNPILADDLALRFSQAMVKAHQFMEAEEIRQLGKEIHHQATDSPTKPDDLKEKKELSSGAQGVAFRAKYTGDDPKLKAMTSENEQHYVVIKEVKIVEGEEISNLGALSAFRQESSIVRQLPTTSPYIARGAVIRMNGEEGIASELISYTAGPKGPISSDASKYLPAFSAATKFKGKKGSDRAALKQGLTQILAGFANSIHQAQHDMHQAHLLHLDTALRNFMIDRPTIDDGKLKFNLRMIDFGQSRQMSDPKFGYATIAFNAQERMPYYASDQRAILGDTLDKNYSLALKTDDTIPKPGEIYVRLTETGDLEYTLLNHHNGKISTDKIEKQALDKLLKDKEITLSSPFSIKDIDPLLPHILKAAKIKNQLAKTRTFSVHTDIFAKKCALLEMVGALMRKDLSDVLSEKIGESFGKTNFRAKISDEEALKLFVEHAKEHIKNLSKSDPRRKLLSAFIKSFEKYLTSTPSQDMNLEEITKQDNKAFHHALKSFEKRAAKINKAGMGISAEEALRAVMPNSDLIAPILKSEVKSDLASTTAKSAHSPSTKGTSGYETSDYSPATKTEGYTPSQPYSPSAKESSGYEASSYSPSAKADGYTPSQPYSPPEKDASGYEPSSYSPSTKTDGYTSQPYSPPAKDTSGYDASGYSPSAEAPKATSSSLKAFKTLAADDREKLTEKKVKDTIQSAQRDLKKTEAPQLQASSTPKADKPSITSPETEATKEEKDNNRFRPR